MSARISHRPDKVMRFSASHGYIFLVLRNVVDYVQGLKPISRDPLEEMPPSRASLPFRMRESFRDTLPGN